jgi:hypothetical protein
LQLLQLLQLSDSRSTFDFETGYKKHPQKSTLYPLGFCPADRVLLSCGAVLVCSGVDYIFYRIALKRTKMALKSILI